MVAKNLADHYQQGKDQLVGKVFRGEIEGRQVDYRVVGTEQVKWLLGTRDVMLIRLVGNVPMEIRERRFNGGDAMEDHDYHVIINRKRLHDLHVEETQQSNGSSYH